jgi:hypothetical protein
MPFFLINFNKILVQSGWVGLGLVGLDQVMLSLNSVISSNKKDYRKTLRY